MFWVLFALFAAIIYAVDTLIYRRISSKHDEYVIAFSALALGAVLTLPFALGAWTFPTDPFIWFLLLCVIVIWTIDAVLCVYTIKHVPISTLQPIVQLQLVFLFLIGFLILGEPATFGKLLGCALIIVGSLLVGIKTGAKGTRREHVVRDAHSKIPLRARIVAVAAAFTTALGMSFDKTLSTLVAPPLYVWLVYTGPALVLLIGLWPRRAAFVKLWSSSWKWLLLLGVCTVAGYTAVIAAYQNADVTLVVPILKTGVVFAMIGSVIVFPSERVHLVRKAIAGILILCGAFLVLL